jgi:elongation factor G
MEVLPRRRNEPTESRPDREETRVALADSARTLSVEPATLAEQAQTAREHMVELLAEVDDEIMEAWVRNEDLDSQKIREALRRCCLSGKAVPVLCGSALKNFGVQALLDAVILYLPSPLERPALSGTSDDGEKTAIALQTDGPLLSLAFKVTHDVHRGQMVHLRAFRGTLESPRHPLMNVTKGKKELPTALFRVMADDSVLIERVETGDIFAAVSAYNAAPT